MKNLLISICLLSLASLTACGGKSKKKTGEAVTAKSSDLAQTLTGNSWCLAAESRMTFNRDGSFTAEYDNTDDIDKGTWKASNDAITLKGNGEDEEGSLKIKSFSSESFTAEVDDSGQLIDLPFTKCNG